MSSLWASFSLAVVFGFPCASHRASQVVLVVENPSANARRCGFDLLVGKIHWKRTWQPTQVFLSGESHGQRSLAGYSP